MSANLSVGRAHYRPSGRINLVRFIPWLFLAGATAGVLALLMHLAFRGGVYLVVLVPIAVAFALAGVMLLAVAQGHCRNPWLAGAVGLLAGLVTYLGYFYIGMVADVGAEEAGNFGLLPRYIRFRMATQVVQDVGRSHDDEKKPAKPMNWFTLAFEAGIILGIPTVAGLRRARKPYCEGCQQWMKRSLTYFPPDKAGQLCEALASHSARTLGALCGAPEFTPVPSATLALEYCPAFQKGDKEDCLLFASVKNVTSIPGAVVHDTFERSKGKILLLRAQVERDELPPLALRFPMLEPHVGGAAVAAARPAEEEDASLAKSEPAPAADIREVESPFGRKVFTLKTKLFLNALPLVMLLAFVGGFLLALWGASMAFPGRNASPATPDAKSLGLALIAVGGLCGGVGAAFALIEPGGPGNRWLRKRVDREFSQRPNCLVDPRDLEAHFVQIVPKTNWGKVKLDDARDIGLLRVDRGRRELLFEGDCERWRIPGAAINYCEIEERMIAQDKLGGTTYCYVVVRVERPGEIWEAPIRERANAGKFKNRRRRANAEKLCQEIKGIQKQGPSF